MSGCKRKEACGTAEVDESYAKELNKFYARFDCYDFEKENGKRLEFLLNMIDGKNMGNKVVLSECEVRKTLRCLNSNKASGPDGVSPSVLKYCADQLGDIQAHLFNISLVSYCVPPA
ncbi:Non-LTR (Long terminal repeat) retrotransposon and domain-containing protein [Elysia marginata]|uniref:Non-LTR (Long terminal repeat) retrotransposon and domain-containing protein n=1 Tax=Elysia marginata TaxID=1093978 RepID=A0AAV4IHB3_9GAST|nr:Non-LTR (Long terminal repeat) retrotransposon and domain-containing protein [Elysia marginata]